MTVTNGDSQIDLRPQYVYTTRRPRANTMKIGDVPGHRMGYIMRRNIVAPPKVAKEFQPRCECGAKSDTWFSTLRYAERRWHDPHKVEAEKQGRLPL